VLVVTLALPAIVPLAAAVRADDAHAAAPTSTLSEPAASGPTGTQVPAPASTAAANGSTAGSSTPKGTSSPRHAVATSTPQEVPSPLPSQHVQRVVGLGDSVPAGSACGCTDYVNLLAHGLGVDVSSTNLAVPGQTSSGLLDQLSAADVRAAVANADVVVVTIGANDVEADDPSTCGSGQDGASCYSSELSGLSQNLDRVVSAVVSITRPGARVLLTGYWNVFLDGAVARAHGADYVRMADAVTREVNSRISSAATANGAVFVDLFTPFRGADGSKDCTELLAPDGDHPDAAGHALIAQTLLAAL